MTDLGRLAYIHNPLDRSANQRGDAAWLAGELASPDLKTVRIAGDKTAFVDGRLMLDRIASDEPPVFLGRDAEGAPWCARRCDNGPAYRDLRSLMLEGAVPSDQLGILAQARSLIHWHERHGFCANCGATTEMRDGGYRRHCAGCETEHFPRTDPVVIMVVRKPGYILLGRQASWATGMYSALAGFMEPGETIEDAARREVFEESGIRVDKATYVASQPWPFPSSLMIGLIGEAASETIAIDAREIEDARWFSFAEAQMMLARSHPQGLYATHPMAIAHHLVRCAIQAP